MTSHGAIRSLAFLAGLWLTSIGPFASAQAEPEPADPALWRQIEHLTELLRAPLCTVIPGGNHGAAGGR